MPFEWSRPWALALLVLPLALLWLARLRGGAPRLATGSLELWRGLEQRTRPAAPRSFLPPAWAWCLALSLAAGALALAGARALEPARGREWTVIVDQSRSMHLSSSPGSPAAGTRLSLARARLAAWLGARDPSERVRWTSPWIPDVTTGAREAPPDAWFEAGAEPCPWPRPRPRFELHDEPGVIWLTDRAPSAAPSAAGVYASGGPEVPGSVAGGRGAQGRVRWDLRDDGALVELPDDRPAGSVALEKRDSIPGLVRELLAIWADERGLVLAGAGPCVLTVRGARSPGDSSCETGRDGWSARVSGLELEASAADRPIESWLSRPAGGSTPNDPALVRSGPGLVELGFARMDEPQGDPAAFAVSWSELFDLARANAPDECSVELRQAAGAPLERAPIGEPGESASPRSIPGPKLDAILCALAALACGAALWLRSDG